MFFSLLTRTARCLGESLTFPTTIERWNSKQSSMLVETAIRKFSNKKCSRKECPKPKKTPECCMPERLAEGQTGKVQENYQCQQQQPELHRKIIMPSVWEYSADCCGNPCPEMLPRFDRLYYRRTEKSTRQYQQTWVECPPLKIVPKKVCCYDKTAEPPFVKRVKKQDDKSIACEYDTTKLKALSCPNATKQFPRRPPPFVRPKYAPLRCNYPKTRIECKKICCPYPAFSECCHPCPNPKRPRECSCLERQPKCIMYRYLRRKLKYDLPPPLPAWPPKLIGPRLS